MKKCEVCGKTLIISEIDWAEDLAWYACPGFMIDNDNHDSYSEPLTEDVAENFLTLNNLAYLENLGWNIYDEDKGGIAVRRWDVTKFDSVGKYDDLVIEDTPYFPVPLYIEYTIDIGKKSTTYISWEGGQNPANCNDIYDDYVNVLESALKDDLFCPAKCPLRYNTIIESGDKMRPAWFDLVQLTHDFACACFNADKGDYFIRVANNSNIKQDEAVWYYPVSLEDAEKLLSLDNIESQIKEMIHLIDQK